MSLEPEALLNASLRDCKPVLLERGSGVPSTVRTDNAPKVRFSVTLGEESEVEVTVV